jgi:ribosomal protein S18 acetylase RimI-like enzyme
MFDRRRGLLDSVFVRRPYRQRGLGRALVLRSLEVLRERGMTTASLGVDSENPNAALHLYEACGFERIRSSTAWRKPLDPTAIG